jgi:urea carboxylase-associated protein 2
MPVPGTVRILQTAFYRHCAKMSPMTKQEIADANRRRYEDLRAAGQGAAPKALPAATVLGGAPISPDAVIDSETAPPGWYHTVRLRRGEALRIVDTSGRSSVSVIGWCEKDASERLNCADTAKIQWSAALSKGRVILTDMGHVFLSLIEDTSGAHDLLMGGSTPASVLAAYGEPSRNTHDNFLAAASKLGLGLRDIAPCVTFFAPVSLDAEGRFIWNGARKQVGDFVDLRAEMDLVLVLSNCAHPLDPARPAAGGPVTVVRHRAPPPMANDPCRTMSPEIVRAFDFTDRLHA